MKKLIICLDGLGKDLISKKNTPFIYKFGKENYFSELATLFAFTGIEYSFFTGKSPAETKIWLEFVRSKNSIFDNILLKKLSFNKKLRTLAGILIQLIKKRSYLCALHNIPKEKLKYFDSKAKEGLWKLDFFQKRNFVFYKWPFFVLKKKGNEKTKLILRYEKDEERLKRLLKEKEVDVYYTQLVEIDKAIHRFGKKSKKTEKILRKIDGVVAKYIKKFLKENEGAEIFLWSDHGFADIKDYINIRNKLPSKDVFFIGGTTIHFWFNNKERKKAIQNILKKEKIKILNEKDAQKYKIPLSKEYGDLIGYLKKGRYFFPNFYQEKETEKFKAMHGYPDDKELNGFLISNKKIPKKLNIFDVLKYLDK